MDFSSLFSEKQGTKSFEERVSPDFNGALPNGQNEMLSFLLPILNGGQMNSDSIIKMLANQNPNLKAMLPLISNLNNTKKEESFKKSKIEYVKISDYYKK